MIYGMLRCQRIQIAAQWLRNGRGVQVPKSDPSLRGYDSLREKWVGFYFCSFLPGILVFLWASVNKRCRLMYYSLTIH